MLDVIASDLVAAASALDANINIESTSASWKLESIMMKVHLCIQIIALDDSYTSHFYRQRRS